MAKRLNFAAARAIALVWIDTIPVALPTALAAFGTVTMVLLILGQLRNLYVWPLGLLAAGAAVFVVARNRRQTYPGNVFERNFCNVLILVAVIGWMGFNALYTTQHVFTDRDPGTYAVASEWFVNHQTAVIDAPAVFGTVTGIDSFSAGFSPASVPSPHLDAQGLHLLPALLGLMGRIMGDVYMLHVQVLFGGLALLALYGFARLITRPYWALLATLAMAVSLPMIYFSRDTYTEPLAMAFTFGALALLWEAITRANRSLWLLAGLTAGAGMLTRIDGFLTVDALLGFVVIYLAVAPKSQRISRLWQAVLLTAGMLLTSFIGWLDVSRLSAHYYSTILPEIRGELLLGLAVIIGGAAVVALALLRGDLVRRLDMWSVPWRAKALSFVLAGTALFLISRPLWYVGYLSGKAVATHSYAELTIDWVIWYIGPLLAIASFAGLIVLTYRLLKKNDLLVLPAFLVIAGTALFYLYDPHIYPDQMWGSRRLLPVILPGLAVFGAIGLEWLYNQGVAGWLQRRLPKKHDLDIRTLTVVVATIAAITPLVISAPALFVSESAWLSPVKEICRALPAKAAVLWVGAARTQLTEPTNAFCNVPSEGYGHLFVYTQSPSRQALASAAKNAIAHGYQPIIGTFVGNADLIGGAAKLTSITSYTYQQLERTYFYPPHTVLTFQDSILLGKIDAHGNISPL